MRIDARRPRALAMLVLLVTIFESRNRAQALERVRPESPLLTRTIGTAAARSTTFRSMVDRIERSDLIVHLTCNNFRSALTAGRTILASAGPDVRYLRVQVLCQQSQCDLVTIVAHELEHVLEIAAVPSVVDGNSFTRLYRTIGFSNGGSPSTEQFETAAAMATGEQVRREYLRHSDSGTTSTRQFERPRGNALTHAASLERAGAAPLTD